MFLASIYAIVLLSSVMSKSIFALECITICQRCMKGYQTCRNQTSDFCPENLKTTSVKALRYVEANGTRQTHLTNENCKSFAGLGKCKSGRCNKDKSSSDISWLVFTMAIVTISGNATVIVYGIKAFKKGFASRSKVEKIHNILILNLSIADLLMGFYLLIFGIIRNSENFSFHTDSRCTAIAIVNFVSSQVSVTSLTIITSCRLFSVLRPYRSISVRLVVGVVCITWILWLIISIMPLLAVDKCDMYEFDEITPRFVNASSEVCGNGTTPDHYNLTDKCLTARYIFGSVDCLRKPPTFYNSVPACSMRFFFHNDEDPWIAFTLCIISFNCLAFVYMLVAYCFICRSATPNTNCNCSVDICGGLRKCFCGSEQETQREAEDRRMHRRIFFIVCTDFLCWVPVSLTAIFFLAFPPDDSHRLFKTYEKLSIFIVVVLPLNSAINPILYSTVLIRKFCQRKENSRQDLSVEMAPRDTTNS